MKKIIKQFRYYGDDGSGNEPKELNRDSLVRGSAFSKYTPIVHLGIQTAPGVKFYLNKSTESTMVGKSGLFELDLEEQVQITALSFDHDSIKKIAKDSSNYLIVDIIYEGEE